MVGDRAVDIRTTDDSLRRTGTLLSIFANEGATTDREGLDIRIEAQTNSTRGIGVDGLKGSLLLLLRRRLELGLGVLLRAGEEQTDSCDSTKVEVVLSGEGDQLLLVTPIIYC